MHQSWLTTYSILRLFMKVETERVTARLDMKLEN